VCCDILRERAVLMLVAVSASFISRHAAGETPIGSEQRTQIRKALDALVQSPVSHDAEDAFLHMSEEAVVPALVGALRDEDAFSARFPDRRRRVYYVLIQTYLAIGPKRSGEVAKLAYEQIMNGLLEDNYYIKASCAGALAAAPKEVHEEVALAIGSLLRDVLAAPHAQVDEAINEETGAPRYCVLDAVRTLGSLEDFGKPYLSDIERVFRDERASISVRSTALDAMLRLGGIVGGIDGVLDQFQDVDSGAATILLGKMGARGAETNGLFDGNPAHQRAIREFVVESLESPSVEVRRAAFESLIFVFGDAGVVFDSPSNYRLNPEIEQALAKIAACEADGGLRQRAAGALQQLRERLDLAAQKILRKRQDRGNQPHDRDGTH